MATRNDAPNHPSPEGELEQLVHIEEFKRGHWKYPKYSVQIGNLVLRITDFKAEAMSYRRAVEQTIESLINQRIAAVLDEIEGLTQHFSPGEARYRDGYRDEVIEVYTVRKNEFDTLRASLRAKYGDGK